MLKKIAMHSKKIFSDNSCTTEGTVIRINPWILHGKNLRPASQSNPLKTTLGFQPLEHMVCPFQCNDSAFI